MKRLAVFDVDGTLIDSRQAISDALRDAWIALDLEPPSYEQSRRIVGLSLAEAFRALEPTLPVERYEELTQAYKTAFLRNREAGHSEALYEGARDMLEALRGEGWLLGIATGKARRGYEHLLRLHGLTEWFDAAFCADDGPGKPDPHMLQSNMQKLGIEPGRTVMIGDTSFDMAMARAAGCYALGVTWGFHTEDEVRDGGAHEVVRDFPALSLALTRWAGAQQQQQQQQQQ